MHSDPAEDRDGRPPRFPFRRLPVRSETWLSERIADGRVLKPDRSGDFDTKVLLAKDGRVFKFFRLRRRLSSGRIYPFPLRFARHAARLRAMGFCAPRVHEIFRVPEIERQVAVYEYIDGTPLRGLLSDEGSDARGRERLHGFGRFLAELHERGVAFRAGHLNNYLQVAEPDERGAFGLIDVSDVAFSARALSASRRVENLGRLIRTDTDRKVIARLGWSALLEGYRETWASHGGRPEELPIDRLPA